MIVNGRVINEVDRQRLSAIVSESGHPPGGTVSYITALSELLEVARPVPPQEVPPDLVTMNSVVRVRDPENGDLDLYRLVYPHNVLDQDMALSVLTPIGAAMFGRRVGEEIQWRSPRRVCRAIIDDLDYQPERAGDYDR